MRHLFLLAWLIPLLAGCSEPGPTADKPWVLVLAEAPTHEAARSQAAELSAGNAALEGTAGVTVRDRAGRLRHLVVGPPQQSQEALRLLRAKLAGGKPLRLESLDVRTVALIEKEQAFGASPPEQVETLEQVARLLPAPGELELRSFLVLAQPGEKPGPAPLPPARSGRRPFSKGFGALGWEATGEATYSSGAGPERVHWFVGFGPKGEGALEAAHRFLQAYVRPEQAAVEPEPEEDRPARRKKARRRKAGKRTPKKRGAAKIAERKAPEPPKEEEATEAAQVDLPETVVKAMPWGPAQVVVVERVALTKPRPPAKAKPKKRRRRRTLKRRRAARSARSTCSWTWRRTSRRPRTSRIGRAPWTNDRLPPPGPDRLRRRPAPARRVATQCPPDSQPHPAPPPRISRPSSGLSHDPSRSPSTPTLPD